MAVETQETTEWTVASDDPAVRPAPRRGLGWVAGLLLIVVLVTAGIALLPNLLPSLPNPFATDRVDRTGPAVLLALEELSEYRAATGHFQVILDVEDDARFLPSALRGERTLFVAAGTVDAVVDFDGIGPDAVEVSEDRTSAVIRLPEARLADPRVDPEQSYVYERRRGLLDRIGSMFSDTPSSDRELFLLAEERLAAAAAETDLTDAAERNTTTMLRALLESLGFTSVAVHYGTP
jgi:hypothetical protein